MDYYSALCYIQNPRSRRNQSRKEIWQLRRPFTSINGTKNMVEYSFIVQKSVTCLDLSLCEFSKFKSKPERNPTLINNKSKYLDGRIEANNDIFTVEAYKKRFAHNRKLLYDYHLDVCKELDVNLRNDEPVDIKDCYSDRVLLNEIHVEYTMHERCLSEIIEKTFKETNEKVRLIHKVSKIAKHLNKFRQYFLSNEYTWKQWLVFLCSQKANSTIVMDFLNAMDFKSDDFNLSEEDFKLILDHIGYNLWSDPSYEDPIHKAIFNYMSAKAISLFQYLHSPRFCGKLYKSLTNPVRGSLPRAFNIYKICVPVQDGLINEERHFLILEILHVFYRQSFYATTALQLLWRSIPDPFIILYELNLVFAQFHTPPSPDSKIVQEILRFMKEVTGEDVRDKKEWHPRKLQHYCRTVIRRSLSISKQLSTGIGKMKLPPKIDSFLRLES